MRVRIWPSTFKGQLRSKIFLLFEAYIINSYPIFDVKDFRVWPWHWTPKGHLRSKKRIPFESPSMTFYLTSMDNISLSRTVFEIFDFIVFRVRPWPLTPKSHLGSKIVYHSKAHIWLAIWLPWTTSLYLVPFSRYSTLKFLGFDLDLWPLKIIWGQKNLYHSKAHIWLPIWLLWTTSLYLVPFSRYSTSRFLGFDLDLWPQKVIWGQKMLYYSKVHIWLAIWLQWTTSLYLVPFQRYSTSKLLGFDLDLWPLNVIWGEKKFILFESPYMTCYLTFMDNISLSRTVFEIFDFEVFRVWLWPLTPKGHLGSKDFIPFESPCMTSYLTSMNTISLSRTVLEIMLVKFLKAEQNGGFWPFKGQGQVSIFFYHRKGTFSHQTASFEIWCIKIGSAV